MDKVERPRDYFVSRTSEWGVELEPAIKWESWEGFSAWGRDVFSHDKVNYRERPALTGDWYWSHGCSSPCKMIKIDGLVWEINAIAQKQKDGNYERINGWKIFFSGRCWADDEAAALYRAAEQESKAAYHEAWLDYKPPWGGESWRDNDKKRRAAWEAKHKPSPAPEPPRGSIEQRGNRFIATWRGSDMIIRHEVATIEEARAWIARKG